MLFSFLHVSKWQSRKENISNLVSVIFSPLLLRHIFFFSHQKDNIFVFKALYLIIRMAWTEVIAVWFMTLVWSCLLVPFLSVYWMTVLSDQAVNVIAGELVRWSLVVLFNRTDSMILWLYILLVCTCEFQAYSMIFIWLNTSSLLQ